MREQVWLQGWNQIPLFFLPFVVSGYMSQQQIFKFRTPQTKEKPWQGLVSHFLLHSRGCPTAEVCSRCAQKVPPSLSIKPYTVDSAEQHSGDFLAIALIWIMDQFVAYLPPVWFVFTQGYLHMSQNVWCALECFLAVSYCLWINVQSIQVCNFDTDIG